MLIDYSKFTFDKEYKRVCLSPPSAGRDTQPILHVKWICYSVGIDVSKGKSTVCIMKPRGEILVAPFDILHTMESVLALAHRLKAYEEEVRVVLEDTVHYHWPVVTVLTENDIFVCCVNALRMKKYCSQSLRRAKTDKIDSVKIASYGITYWSELIAVLPNENTYKELQILSRQYYQYTSLIVKAKVNLSNLLDQTMPCIETLLQDSACNHKLTDFVKRYWHFSHILEMGEFKFIADYCKWAEKQGYRMNERKANDIFALSQNGIPVISNTLSTKIVMLETVRILHELEKSRDTILTHMKQLANTLPEYSVVFDMGGVGQILAPKLIAEIGDVRRFHSRSALTAYAGIDAPPYQSGTFAATERHISKRGNKYLRKTGYEVMQSLIQHKPSEDVVYQFIEKKRSEGKCCKEAMIAGLNKFLRIYYARVSETYKEIEEQLVFSSEI
jgi:transposase